MYILTPQKTVFSRVLLLYILSGYTASLEKIKNGQPEKKTGDTRIFISEIATGYDWLIKLWKQIGLPWWGKCEPMLFAKYELG